MSKENACAHRLEYVRKPILPTVFCPGCGGGTVLNVLVHALDEERVDQKDLVAVTGIGCASWLPSPYLKSDTLHCTHGRAIPFATGVKVQKPELQVMVIAGDGDLSGIGGNHLIHAARRNIGLKVFLVNNFIYGMTGGQVAPTTPIDTRTATTPYGNPEPPFNIAQVVAAAGANYVARWTTYHAFQLKSAMKKAFATPGFTFVEIISQCPVSYGKSTKQDAVQMLQDFKDRSVPFEKSCGMTEDELEGQIVVGELVSRSRPEFTTVLEQVREKAQEEDK